MAERRDSYPIPVHLFGALHPALATLEQVMNDHVVAHDIFNDLNKEAKESYQEIEPTRWTALIESARKSPVELARLRVQYGEQALTFVSQWLQWNQAAKSFSDNRNKLNDAIVAVLGDIIDQPFPGQYPIAAIQAKIVEARALHWCDVGDDEPKVRKTEHLRAADHWKAPERSRLHCSFEINEKLRKIQYAAFRALTAKLSENIRHGMYTTEPVVDPDMLKGAAGRATYFRQLQYANFSGGENGTYAASVKLFEQGVLLEGLRTELYRVLPSEQNGRINERQHALRLIDLLGPDAGAGKVFCRVDNLDEQIDAQEGRRLSFENYRQSVILRLHLLRESITTVVKTLQEAALETSAFLAEVERDHRATRDSLDYVRIMINNCLAADQRLRSSVNDLIRTQANIEPDLSLGAGKQALSTAFADSLKHYDNQVVRRREQQARSKEVSVSQK